MRIEEVTPDLRMLTFDFFHRFSRLEFALKEADYLHNRNPGSWALPGWNDFIERWESEYRPSARAFSLIEAAPREQVIAADGRTLEFREVRFKSDATKLRRVTKLVQVVRNNLFHGGKHDAAGWDSASRIALLLPLSISVLDELAVLGGLSADYEATY